MVSGQAFSAFGKITACSFIYLFTYLFVSFFFCSSRCLFNYFLWHFFFEPNHYRIAYAMSAFEAGTKTVSSSGWNSCVRNLVTSTSTMKIVSRSKISSQRFSIKINSIYDMHVPDVRECVFYVVWCSNHPNHIRFAFHFIVIILLFFIEYGVIQQI